MGNDDDEIRNIALYTRVSTDEQAEKGYSLESQLDRLRAYCTAREWNIIGEYVDPGFSGRNVRRPQYTQMMKDIDRWDGVLVIKMDRIHRNQQNFIAMMDHFRKIGKQFVSMQESIDTSTAMGRFVMTSVIQGIAQLESEQNGERVTVAMKKKAITKGYVGHRLAFGYKLVDGKIVEISEKLEIVKQIFKLYSEGKSINDVSKLTGKPWGTVRYVLNNVWYVGYEQWSNCFKRHCLDPAISLDLWNMAQQKKRTKTGRTQKLKPFIIPELIDSFKLSDREMREHGFGMDISRHKVGG